MAVAPVTERARRIVSVREQDGTDAMGFVRRSPNLVRNDELQRLTSGGRTGQRRMSALAKWEVCLFAWTCRLELLAGIRVLAIPPLETVRRCEQARPGNRGCDRGRPAADLLAIRGIRPDVGRIPFR